MPLGDVQPPPAIGRVRRLAVDGEYRQQDAARDLVRQYGLTPANTDITLTGAWIDDDGDGCVHSVRETLEEFGFEAKIEDAMNLDFELECEDDFEMERETPGSEPTVSPGRPKGPG